MTLLLVFAAFVGMAIGVVLTLAHVANALTRTVAPLALSLDHQLKESADWRLTAAEIASLRVSGGQSAASPAAKPGLPDALRAAYAATSVHPGQAANDDDGAAPAALDGVVGLKTAIRRPCAPCAALRRLLRLKPR